MVPVGKVRGRKGGWAEVEVISDLEHGVDDSDICVCASLAFAISFLPPS